MIEIRDSYWVEKSRFMAGEYPGSSNEQSAQSKLEWLLSKNINFFINLTEPGEYGLKPYTKFLENFYSEEVEQKLYKNFPIPDMQTPSVPQMVEILNLIDNKMNEGRNIYLHCYGGIGRTGTVVGCYFVRHGMVAQEALNLIANLRRFTPDGWRPSPETSSQRQMVLNWSE